MPGRFGVWDSATNEWNGDWTLTQAEANQQAHELDTQHHITGDRPARDVRRLPAPRAVERYGWQPVGDLDAWVRDDGVWWGRVRGEDGLYSWIRGSELQPAPPDLR